MNSAKCQAVMIVVAISLAVWLVSGCKQAIGPIEPAPSVHDHGHGEEEESRRKPPPTAEGHKPPGPPGLAEPEHLVDDLDEAIKLLRNSDSHEAKRGGHSLDALLTKGKPAQRRATLEALRELLLHGDTGTIRKRAALVLVGWHFERTYPLLLRALDDPDTDVLVNVLLTLAGHSSKPSLVRRARELLDHPDNKVSRAAAEALTGMYSRSKNVTGLISLLGIYKHDLSAKAAIRLSVMGRETVPELIQALKSSPDADQRHGAAMLLAMICGGANPQQQKFAEMARSESAPFQKAPRLPDHRAVKPLIEAVLHDPSERVREISAQGLGYFGDAQAAPALAKVLTEDRSAAVRRRAAAALITVPAFSVSQVLEKAALTDESETVRRYAAEALGWLGSPLVVPTLVELTEDKSPEVRRYVAVQLGRLAEEGKLTQKLHQQALVSLVKLFDDSSSDVRWAAVMSVGKLHDKAAVSLLVKALDDPVPMVSHAAERGLQKLGLAERKAEEFEKYYQY